MAIGNRLRRLRGALGNALAWGVGWFTAGFAIFATLRIVGILTVPWKEVLTWAARAGIVGTVTGGAFSLAIGLLYHGRRLPEIGWVRFGIGGGVVAGSFVPLFLQTMNLLSGDGLVPWKLVLDDVPLAAVLGGIAAGGSLKLAQHADALPPGGRPDQIDPPEGRDHLALEGDRDA